jgi:alkylation response protein AidB-like acyl-CoA dehydrogenase
MRVELSDEQEFLREAVAGVVARDAGLSKVRGWAEDGAFAASNALAESQGWTGIGLSEEAGGQGGTTVELAVLAEQLGRGAVPWDRTLAGCLLGPVLVAAGGEEALALAAASAEGDRVAVLAVDGCRPVAADVSPPARGRLTATPRYVPGAAEADELVVPVDLGGEIAIFVVPVEAAGVSVRRRTIVDRTRSLADVVFDDAVARPLGSVPTEVFDATASTAAVMLAADALGAASRLLELTTRYVVERRQFGVPVGSFQAVKHAAAEMLVDVEASRSAVLHAAWAAAAGVDDARLHASIAKAYACSAAMRVADKALFLHGAVGYTWEHDLQFLFKRAKSDALLFGSPDAYRDRIALDLALDPSVAREAAPIA